MDRGGRAAVGGFDGGVYFKNSFGLKEMEEGRMHARIQDAVL